MSRKRLFDLRRNSFRVFFNSEFHIISTLNSKITGIGDDYFGIWRKNTKV